MLDFFLLKYKLYDKSLKSHKNEKKNQIKSSATSVYQMNERLEMNFQIKVFYRHPKQVLKK